MYILFGPYGCLLSKRGISSHPLMICEDAYRIAVEQVAKEYLHAGATLPTVNAFFLRSLLHQGNDQLYLALLQMNFEALLSALGDRKVDQVLISLGPSQDCYLPERAPDAIEACHFAKRQYQHCLRVTKGFTAAKIAVLHETIGTLREALGIGIAAKSLNLPVTISFVVDLDGYLLDGTPVERAIASIDAETDGFVQGYAMNCCSPFAFEKAVDRFQDPQHLKRIVGFYPNSWNEHPAQYEADGVRNEPDKAFTLKRIANIGRQYGLQFVGGCCGFDEHDIQRLSKECDLRPD